LHEKCSSTNLSSHVNQRPGAGSGIIYQSPTSFPWNSPTPERDVSIGVKEVVEDDDNEGPIFTHMEDVRISQQGATFRSLTPSPEFSDWASSISADYTDGGEEQVDPLQTGDQRADSPPSPSAESALPAHETSESDQCPVIYGIDPELQNEEHRPSLPLHRRMSLRPISPDMIGAQDATGSGSSGNSACGNDGTQDVEDGDEDEDEEDGLFMAPLTRVSSRSG